MAPTVLRRTPHDARLLDRTGIISASKAESAATPADASGAVTGRWLPRSNVMSLLAAALMIVVAVGTVLDLRAVNDPDANLANGMSGAGAPTAAVPAAPPAVPAEPRIPASRDRPASQAHDEVPGSLAPVPEPEPEPAAPAESAGDVVSDAVPVATPRIDTDVVRESGSVSIPASGPSVRRFAELVRAYERWKSGEYESRHPYGGDDGDRDDRDDRDHRDERDRDDDRGWDEHREWDDDRDRHQDWDRDDDHDHTHSYRVDWD